MATDLTTGKEGKAMILFALPLILGDIFQQFYNLADTIIVGRYIGPEALAAVGSSFSVMVFLTSILLGLCMGASVLFSQLFGAKQEDLLKQSIFTAFLLIGGITLLLNIGVLFWIDEILQFMHIPPEIYEQTKTYLQIIFGGMVFTFLYNYFSSILRSMGNSVVPLIFLILAAGLNIALDIVFVAVLSMGIQGAAYATVASQALSGALTMGYCFFQVPELKLQKKDFQLDFSLLKRITNYSVSASIQQSIMNFGILMIQGLVNSFGVTVMAAFAAAVKVDAFAYMPAQDFGNAFSIYIAQNKGAREYRRIKQGVKVAFRITTVFCALASLVVVLLSKELMAIFIDRSEQEIISYGVEYLVIVGCFYCLIGYLFLFYGYYRGMGHNGVSIILTIISLGLRVTLAYLFAPLAGVTVIWWAIPIGWMIADMLGCLWMRYPITTPSISIWKFKSRETEKESEDFEEMEDPNRQDF